MEHIEQTINTNTNVNAVKTINTKTLSQATFIAEKLASELNNPGSYQYYLKIAWHLPEGTIWRLLDQAQQGTYPQRLFTWLTKPMLDTANH